MVDTQKLILSDLADTLARDSAALDGLLDDLVRENAALADTLARDSAALDEALARWRDGLADLLDAVLARWRAGLDQSLTDALARDSAALEQLLDNLALDIDFDALLEATREG
mgnify:CR=1 FL=1